MSQKDSSDDEYLPAFVGRLRVDDRVVLAFLLPVGIIAFAAAISACAISADDPVDRGLLSSAILLASALVASVVLMFLPRDPASMRRAVAVGGSLVMNAALVSALSLAESLSVAFLRSAVFDPIAGDTEMLSAVFVAVSVMVIVLGIITAVAKRTYALPGLYAPLMLCLAAAPALLLYQASVAACVGVVALTSVASALLIRERSRNPQP